MHLVVDLLYGPAYHVAARNSLVSAEDVLGSVVAINMSRNEIYRRVMIHAMADESVHPGGLRGRRPAHP